MLSGLGWAVDAEMGVFYATPRAHKLAVVLNIDVGVPRGGPRPPPMRLGVFFARTGHGDYACRGDLKHLGSQDPAGCLDGSLWVVPSGPRQARRAGARGTRGPLMTLESDGASRDAPVEDCCDPRARVAGTAAQGAAPRPC